MNTTITGLKRFFDDQSSGYPVSNSKEELFYCKNCDSDPFTRIQKCSNFEKTLGQFHVDQGHAVIPYSKRGQSITELFTQAMSDSLPQNITELKESLRNSNEYDIDRTKTIGSDTSEFSKGTKGGFYAYEEKNLSQHFTKDFVSDIMLPGHVYDGKESCGKCKLIGCLEGDMHDHDGGYVRKTVQRCYYKGCRKCASYSIKREANAITNRLMTFCNLKSNRKIYLKENRSRILLHVVISIPHDEEYQYLVRGGRKKLRKKARDILNAYYDVKNKKLIFGKEAKMKLLSEHKPILRNNVDGGVMIDHPYRFSKGLESARFSPHFHDILTGWISGEFCSKVYEKTGWIIKNISTIETWKDCYGLSKYLLSHEGVFMKEEGKRSAEHSVRYIGECHNKRFKVDRVLKYSTTGNEQLDLVLYTRKEIEKKGVIYKLQKVSYTHSIIQKEIKDSQNEYFEAYPNGNVLELSKSLRQYIEPTCFVTKDNPAIPQSDPPSMEFLQMRFDYGLSRYDIVQSVYVNVIFDTDLDELCPECSLKMQTLAPPRSPYIHEDNCWSDQQAEVIADLLMDIPQDVTVPIDDITQFNYLKNVGISLLGFPYFDFNGKLKHDTGIYERPENLDLLNPKLYWTIIKNIDMQKVRYVFRVEHGRSPTIEELDEKVRLVKSNIIDKSDSILNYFSRSKN